MAWKLPAAQLEQAEPPTPDWSVPWLHEMHTLRPSPDAKVPAAQFPQALSLAWPVSAWNFPVPHSEHWLAPVAIWYVPEAHERHDSCPGNGWTEPAGQSAQEVLEATDPSGRGYLPMAHAVHWLAPAAEMKPFTQPTHTDMPTMLWKVPAAHALHTDEPGVDWNEPTAQLLHTVAPVAFENVPAMHGLQELWPVWP